MQYIGEKEVMTVVELDMKTPAGKDMVEVHYEGGTSEKMPKLRFELLVSDGQSDPSEVTKKLEARVGAVLFANLHEYGIKWGEVNTVADAMVKLVENGYQKAHDIIWGMEKVMVPLIDINNVLLQEHAKQNSDGVTSTRSPVDSSN